MADPRTPTPEVAPGSTAVDGRPAPADRSLPDLLSELSSETTTLVKQEVRLAKAEAREEIREAAKGVGEAASGGAVAYSGLIALVIGLGWGLGQLLGDDLELVWLGITIAGLAVALIGALLLKKGRDHLKALSPPLDTTTQTLNEDKQWIKQETR